MSFQHVHSLPCLLQEVMINVGDVGEDYEHGVQLLKKLGGFRGGGDGVRDQGGGSCLTCMCDVVVIETHLHELTARLCAGGDGGRRSHHHHQQAGSQTGEESER